MRIAAQVLPFIVFAAFIAFVGLLFRRRSAASREEKKTNKWSPMNELKFVAGMFLVLGLGILLLLVLGRIR
jgi:H+/Cl- antiporter ClcA